MRISWVVVLAPIQAFSVGSWLTLLILLISLELKEGVLTAVSQNGASTVSDKGKRSRKACSRGSTGKAGNGGDGELHFGW